MRDGGRWDAWVAGLLAAGLLALLALAGCAQPAQAEPLEVTYYYLPG